MQALGMLFWHKHNIEKSLADLPNFTPFPDEWTVEDKVLFEQAFSFHGKSFHRIQQMVNNNNNNNKPGQEHIVTFGCLQMVDPHVGLGKLLQLVQPGSVTPEGAESGHLTPPTLAELFKAQGHFVSAENRM